MPVELEYKYVLKNIDNLFNILKDNIPDHIVYEIQQAYMSGKGRVRKKSYDVPTGTVTKYEFNYKEFLGEGNGNLEIEKIISKEDFDMAYNMSHISFYKKRFVFRTKNYTWEVDFFIKDDDVYFVMMECEVEKGVIPDKNELPDCIKKNIIYDVPLDNPIFTSKKIADKDRAIEIYDGLVKTIGD